MGQTLASGITNPLVVAAAAGSTALLVAIIQTPGVSQFFGCTPLGPIGWSIAGGWSIAATGVTTAASGLVGGREEPAG
jgi:hypothetical protein